MKPGRDKGLLMKPGRDKGLLMKPTHVWQKVEGNEEPPTVLVPVIQGCQGGRSHRKAREREEMLASGSDGFGCLGGLPSRAVQIDSSEREGSRAQRQRKLWP